MNSILYPNVSIIGSAYLFVTLLLGLQLTFNVFRLRPTTVVSRVAGAAMLMDSMATVARIVANNCGFAGAGWFAMTIHMWDMVITLATLGIGEVLHCGRVVPRRMTVVAVCCVAVQLLLAMTCGVKGSHIGVLLCTIVVCAMYVRQTVVIVRHDRQLVNLYSEVEGHKGSWYAVTCIVFVVETMMWYVLHYLNFGDNASMLSYNVVMIAYWIYIARNVATQVPLSPEVERTLDRPEPVKTDDASRDALLSDDRVAQLREQIGALMTEEHLYLDADLNIQTLTERLHSNRRYVSYVLNQCMNTNFSEYVNRYRIAHVKHMMETTNFKLAAIAYESGFNSPGSMSRTFRALEGIAPQDYRKHTPQ